MKRFSRQFVLFGIIVIGLLFLISCGKQIDSKSKGYYRDIKGIYFSPNNNYFELGMTYLHNVDSKTFVVLGYDFAKDKHRVYYRSNEVDAADVMSFRIDSTGLPKDNYHVFVYDPQIDNYRVTKCGIDPKTAERPFHENNGQDWIWLRDKDYVYMRELSLDVDRITFHIYADWFVDKNQIYTAQWNSRKKIEELVAIDSTQTPLDTLPNSCYLRNGKNIIYQGRVVVRNMDIYTVKRMGIFSCAVNDMILQNGKIRLKDTVDVPTLQIISEGILWKDRNHVYWRWKILKEIDAMTFQKVGDDTYKDKNGYYQYNETNDYTPLKRKE